MTKGRRLAGPRSWLGRLWRPLVPLLLLAVACFGFLAPGEGIDRALRVIASLQIFPALAGALSFSLIASLASGALAFSILALSGLFGRWYCATLCPLGAIQDLASMASLGKGRYRRPATLARILAAAASVCLLVAGAAGIASWLDPWALFSRFMANGVQPIARLAAREDLSFIGLPALLPPLFAVGAIVCLSLFSGRWFCGTLCPVGSVLGLLNRVAPFRLRMDDSACVSCGLCAASCPASCIDAKAKRLDDSRCVYCLECVRACPTSALRYGRRLSSPKEAAALGLSRSGFLAVLGGGVAAMALAALPGRRLLAGLGPAVPASTPPGSGSLERFLDSCVACGLCSARCPSRVLQPSLGRLGLRGLFVPSLDFDLSYCQYECTTCLDICPSGALARMPLASKKLVKMGDASLVRDRCIVFTNKTKCGACAERCPTGAVRMVASTTGIPEPVFASATCIGCGACHYACPALPLKAITVKGLALHGRAEPPSPKPLEATTKAADPGQAASGDFPF